MSFGQRESLRFDFHEDAAERAHAPVEASVLGALKVGEEAAEPGRQVLFEQFAVGAGRRRELSAGDPGRNLAQGRSAISAAPALPAKATPAAPMPKPPPFSK